MAVKESSMNGYKYIYVNNVILHSPRDGERGKEGELKQEGALA